MKEKKTGSSTCSITTGGSNSFPFEIWCRITFYLEDKAFLGLKRTCKYFAHQSFVTKCQVKEYEGLVLKKCPSNGYIVLKSSYSSKDEEKRSLFQQRYQLSVAIIDDSILSFLKEHQLFHEICRIMELMLDRNQDLHKILEISPNRYFPWGIVCYYSLGWAIYTNYLPFIDKLLKIPEIRPSTGMIELAVFYNRLEVVKLFSNSPAIDSFFMDNQILITAIKSDRLCIVKLLLKDPRVDPSANNNEAIRGAAYRGNFEIVKELLKDTRVDPSANNNEAIRDAVELGCVEIVKILLQDPRVDPSANDNQSLRLAYRRDMKSIISLLLNDSRVDGSIVQ